MPTPISQRPGFVKPSAANLQNPYLSGIAPASAVSAVPLLGDNGAGPAAAPGPIAPSPVVSGAAPTPAGGPEVTPQRQRLAEAILSATGGGQPQPVNHPTQAIGNAVQQVATARLEKMKAAVPGAQAKGGPSAPSSKGGAMRSMQRPRPFFKPANVFGRKRGPLGG